MGWGGGLLPAHDFVLQLCTPVEEPLQVVPPYCGEVQVRVREEVPPPQVTLHWLHSDQSLQTPSTENTDRLLDRCTDIYRQMHTDVGDAFVNIKGATSSVWKL